MHESILSSATRVSFPIPKHMHAIFCHIPVQSFRKKNLKLRRPHSSVVRLTEISGNSSKQTRCCLVSSQTPNAPPDFPPNDCRSLMRGYMETETHEKPRENDRHQLMYFAPKTHTQLCATVICFFLFSPFRSAKTTVRPALSAAGGSEIMLSEIYMKETLIPAPLLPHGDFEAAACCCWLLLLQGTEIAGNRN